MALNLRLPEEIDAQLTEIADAEHTSKHSLIVQATARLVRDYSRRANISAALDHILEHDAELLTKLEDA